MGTIPAQYILFLWVIIPSERSRVHGPLPTEIRGHVTGILNLNSDPCREVGVLPLCSQLGVLCKTIWNFLPLAAEVLEWGVQDKHPGEMSFCGLGVL